MFYCGTNLARRVANADRCKLSHGATASSRKFPAAGNAQGQACTVEKHMLLHSGRNVRTVLLCLLCVPNLVVVSLHRQEPASLADSPSTSLFRSIHIVFEYPTQKIRPTDCLDMFKDVQRLQHISLRCPTVVNKNHKRFPVCCIHTQPNSHS